MSIQIRRLVILALLLGACDGDGLTRVQTLPPVVASVEAQPGPHNVLSAVVAAEVSLADSVAVEYGVPGGPLDVTPAVVPQDGMATIPVLGLHAAAAYVLRAVAFGAGVTRSVPLHFSTGALPHDLPSFTATGDAPAPGFVMLAAGRYGIILDNTGRVVWYRHFAEPPGLNFQAQPNGRYTARPQFPDQWVELDILGNVTRTLRCAGPGLTPRFHDAIMQEDGSYWLLCDETRTMDLSAHGGVTNARVMGTVVQKIAAHGGVLFEWSTYDHFAITDLPASQRTGEIVNWTHANAIDLDADGNLLLSFRSLSEITKIDTKTGNVVWRMGGLANQFTFEGTPVPPFAAQHSVRATPGGLLLLDNLGTPAESRAERYALDENARTARLEKAYGSAPPVVALLGGTAQPLAGGHTLVSFGNGGRVDEYDAQGDVVWRINNPGYVFRAQRIASLYRPGAQLAR